MFGLSDFAVVRTLRNRIRGGVDTTVYYDPTGSPRMSGKLSGARLYSVQQSGLMHQKILILDKNLVFIGSANMTTASLQMHDNLVVGLRSQLVANFLLDHPPYTPGALRAMVGGQDLELWLLPDPRGHVIEDLRRCIRNASRSIKIALFTFTHSGLCEELIAAQARGVAVTLVVDLRSGLGASAKAVQQLRAAGISVLFSQGSQLLHHKFLLIDDRTLISGSANWTKAAFYKNSDCILVLHQLTPDQKKFMQSLWRRVATEAQVQKNIH
jgi:phosphatidylserine/phosphatidylglycerophosphate/cardiolipin synthase-like enzyme